MTAEQEKLARVEPSGIRPFVNLKTGKHTICTGTDLELKRACDLLNTVAESWYQERSKPLVESLERITSISNKFSAGAWDQIEEAKRISTSALEDFNGK
jgi:hypothetical protein